MERHGIDTNRVHRAKIKYSSSQQQWFVDSRNECWRIVFGDYYNGEGWEFQVFEHVETYANEDPFEALYPPEYYATPETMLARVADWMENL
jgi:hypothetical protein